MHVTRTAKLQSKLIAALFTLLISSGGFASSLVLEGILEDTVLGPIPSVTVGTVDVSIKTHDGACVLYTEQHTNIDVDVNAKFSVLLGSGSVISNPYGITSIEETFVNDNRFSSAPCAYNPMAEQTRKVSISFSGGALTAPMSLSMDLGHTPFAATAYIAEKSKTANAIGTSSEVNLLRVAGTTTAALTPANYSELMALLSGSSTVTPTKLYCDTKLAGHNLPAPTAMDDQKFIKWNNTSSAWEYAAAAGGTITSIAPGSGSPVTVSGTTAIQLGLNTGTALEVVAGAVQVKIGASCSTGNYAYWSSVSGAFECAPVAVATTTTPGIVSILAQSFAGVKTFINDVVINGNLSVGGIITGNLTGTASNASGIGGRSVAATAPNDGEVLTWHSGSSTWKPMAASGGGGGLVVYPVSASTFSVSATTHKGALLDVTNPDAVLTLPSASSAGSGYEVTIAGPNSGNPFVQINASGGDLVGSAAGTTLYGTNASIRLVSNGTRWIPLAMVNAVLGVGTLGMLDLSLNGMGYQGFNYNQSVYQLFTDTSKRIYFAESNGTLDLKVYRRNADGTPDATFGTSGMALMSFPGSDFNYVYYSSMTIAPNGKIYVVGSTSTSGTYALPNTYLPYIAAFNSDGSIDTSFDSDGYYVSSTLDANYNRVVSGSNNKPVVAGTWYNGSYQLGKIWRFTSTGSLDGSWASGGVQTIDMNPYSINFNEAAIDASDNLYIIRNYWDGTSTQNHIIKYDSNGNIVTGFGSSGSQSFFSPSNPTLYPYINQIKFDGSGNLILVGSVYLSMRDHLSVYRLNASTGAFDPSFSSDGELLVSGLASQNLSGYGVSFDSSNRLLVAGTRYAGANNDMALWRVNTNGTLDTTFSEDGMFTHDGALMSNSNDYGYLAYEDGSGRIVVIGKSNYMANYDIFIWRIR